MNFKYYIKRHIASLEPCFNCKLSSTYLLYSLKPYYLGDRCGRVREKKFKKSFLPLFKIYWRTFLQTHHYVSNFAHEWFTFYSRK